ncbi:hypothetical protein DFH09DRAFT_1440908 [Mycena vulgaris]|nr:hypothetical protein DFH09DRAFT_1440908 [Mycena vulgaris]
MNRFSTPALSIGTVIDEENPLDALRRVDHLWFPSDAVVIRAEDMICRVSKGIVVAHSSIFRQMLAYPQPAESINGSPLLHLDDSAADVEVFMRAIFDTTYFMPAQAPVRLDAVVGILRLSYKYEISHLCRRALNHLSVRYYFTSIERYRARSRLDHIICDDSQPIKSLARVIIAATEVGALWLLPIAY